MMEPRHIIAVVGIIAVFSWQNRVKLKSLASAAIARSSPVLSSSKAGWAAALLALLTAYWPDISPHIPWPSPALEVRQPDIFDDACKSGRILFSEALDEIAGMKFDSDQAAEDFTNDKMLDCMEAAFPPLAKQIEKARAANRLTDMAAKLKAGELRDE